MCGLCYRNMTLSNKAIFSSVVPYLVELVNIISAMDMSVINSVRYRQVFALKCLL